MGLVGTFYGQLIFFPLYYEKKGLFLLYLLYLDDFFRGPVSKMNNQLTTFHDVDTSSYYIVRRPVVIHMIANIMEYALNTL